MTAERFSMMAPVADFVADNEQELANFEQAMRTVEWEDCVRRAGGTPVGEPEITREPNPRYGMAFVDENGDVVLGTDSEPLIDKNSIYLFARGWAER